MTSPFRLLGRFAALPLLALAICCCLAAPGCETGEAEAQADSTAEEEAPLRRARLSRATEEAEVTTIAGLRVVHEDWRRLGYRWSWTSVADLNRGGEVRHLQPLGDAVAIMDSTTRVTILESSSGRLRWATNVTERLTQFVALRRAGDALLAFGRPELFALELSSGNLLARQPLARVVSTEPAIADGTAVFGTPTERVFAHVFGTPDGGLLGPPFQGGYALWQYRLSGAFTATPVLMGRVAGFVNEAGLVFFADARTGSSVGRLRIGDGVVADPVSDGARMYVASLDQSVYAFDPGNPRPAWRYRTNIPLRTDPTVHDGVLYVDIPTEGLVAFDARSGSKNWVSPDASGEVIALVGGELLCRTDEGALLVDAQRGDVLERVDLGGIIELVPEGFVDPVIYARGADGAIARFNPR